MPLKDIMCRDCTQIWEEFIRYPEDEPEKCIYCESEKIETLPSAHGGYQMRGANGASVRPKSSGSFRKSKT